MKPFVRFVLLLAVLPALAHADQPAKSPFSYRGYYFTMTRMPTYGLDAWKQIIDCVHNDGGNTVILWTGGGFRSNKFPETWQHNRDHANVKQDFLRALIDYAHAKKIRILLGVTPFGYDGVNQMSLARPEWRATGPDGKPTRKFGFHSWGYNLCPSRSDTQEFMIDYTLEMYLDSYPNADGLFLESSDYAACHCKDCGARFFDHEFKAVKAISEAVWNKKKDAWVVVYPHCFTGAKVQGLGVTAAKQLFDGRWSLFFTPHSANPDARLIEKSKDALWWDEAVARHTHQEIREGARRARRERCTGYVPSLEVFTYIPTEPEEGQQYLVGKRQVPYGFGWLKEGQIPYNELPVRVNRIAFREYGRNPDLSEERFRAILGKELFGSLATKEAVADALTLQRLFAVGRTWCQPAPLVSPERVKAMKAAGQVTDRFKSELRAALDQVRAIERRHEKSGPPFSELRRIAGWVVKKWEGESRKLLEP